MAPFCKRPRRGAGYMELFHITNCKVVSTPPGASPCYAISGVNFGYLLLQVKHFEN